MILHNRSDRAVRLSKGFELAAGQSVPLAVDAQWLKDAPLSRAYVADGTIEFEEVKAAAAAESAPEAAPTEAADAPTPVASKSGKGK